jgi:hypothetical protein
MLGTNEEHIGRLPESRMAAIAASAVIIMVGVFVLDMFVLDIVNSLTFFSLFFLFGVWDT